MGLSRLLLPVYSQLRGETAVEEHHGQAFFTLKHFSPVCSLLCGEAAMEVHHDQACYKLKLTSACTACPRRAVQGAAGTGGAHSAPLHDAHNTPPAARTHACTTKWRSGHLYPRLHHEVAKWALVPTQWALVPTPAPRSGEVGTRTHAVGTRTHACTTKWRSGHSYPRSGHSQRGIPPACPTFYGVPACTPKGKG
jgi:hypothetical protein